MPASAESSPLGATSLSEPAPEVSLLLRVGSGDATAFDALYERFAPPVFSFVLRIVGSHREAEDVAQDTFVQVWHRASDYRPDFGSPFCWIATIARRKAIDRVRKNTRHRRILAASGEDVLPPPAERGQAAASDDQLVVHRALAVLDANERQALELAYFGGLSCSSIALQAGLAVGTVKSRIRRGLLKMRRAVEALTENARCAPRRHHSNGAGVPAATPVVFPVVRSEDSVASGARCVA